MESKMNTRAPLRAPFTVCIWLTDYCNLACKYCYAMPFSGKKIETRRLLEVLDEFAEMGVFNLTFAGGEPMLHPDILEIIRHSISNGQQVAILTNGTTLNEKLCDELEEIVKDKNFILQISLDSTDPAINDISRGKTQNVVHNIRNLRNRQIEVQLSCVIHKLNVEKAHLIIEEFYPDIKRFHFLNIQRTNQSLKYPELLLSEGEAFQFWTNLNEYSQRFPPDLFLPSLRVQMRSRGVAYIEPEFNLNNDASFQCSSCSAGHTNINLNSDFDVLGCDIAKDFTKMGNVRRRTFFEVWHSEEANAVRNAAIPACYNISSPSGDKLTDWLKAKD
ncbi:radical SAM protein [Bacillus sp. 1813sda1]|uniref:Radical SAM core domain-containing protein n=1 Tax=Bacillus anthracis TaxID=1392 RepID=A0A2A7D1V3_BACAN|nr:MULTISPECIES: radical SAM protein [Bacillus]MCP1166806.1 radical SAM protein [Bacillus sp. 1813sda1]PDZ13924.1 hypothetical protein CON16_27290 [Bacillus anthracis]